MSVCQYVSTSVQVKCIFGLWGRNSSAGMATRYGLDGPGIESRSGGEIFRTCPDRPCGSPSLLYNGYRVSFSRVRRSDRGLDHPQHLATRLKKEIPIPVLPLWIFVACYRVNFTFIIIYWSLTLWRRNFFFNFSTLCI